MGIEEIGRMIGRSLFLSLDRVVAPRLVKFLYVAGVGAILLWTLNHAFATFAFGFGQGLWGLLEIVVFGVFGVVALRIACEALIVYFRANESTVDAANHPAAQTSLLDEVRDAIEDLASDDFDELPPPESSKPASGAKSAAPKAPTKRSPTVRTAKRTPKSSK